MADTAIITGASRGIGAATAEHLHHVGYNVVLVARSKDAIDALAKKLGERARAVTCDVADFNSVNAAVSQTVSEFGSIDLVVNNAGLIDPIARIEDSDPQAWSKFVDVNLKGVYNCVRAAIPHMKSGGGGTIINISSGAATSALEGWSHYCASKAAVLMLTRMIAKEESENSIRAVGLSPGTVATDMQVAIKSSGINPVSKLDPSAHIPPEWVAKAIRWLAEGSAEARAFDGGDFSLKNDKGRTLVGLPPV
ncbi:MAG: SDR family oxidoreductase [Pseudomonadota bacterium]